MLLRTMSVSYFDAELRFTFELMIENAIGRLERRPVFVIKRSLPCGVCEV